MKIILIPVLFILAISGDTCKKREGVYKGRLEVKGMCMNYTIKLLEGTIDTANIATSWTNEVTGIQYSNVFALKSVCTFPESIKEGEEFSFTIDPNPVQNCAVCLAYYPKPSKGLAIKVVNQ